MRGILRCCVVLLLCVAFAVPGSAEERKNRWKKLWISSAAALAGASMLDYGSSVGKYEANPALRGPDGRLSAGRGFAIKFGTAAAVIGAEWLLLRSHREMSSAFTVANFGAGAGFTAVAVRNRGVSP